MLWHQPRHFRHPTEWFLAGPYAKECFRLFHWNKLNVVFSQFEILSCVYPYLEIVEGCNSKSQEIQLNLEEISHVFEKGCGISTCHERKRAFVIGQLILWWHFRTRLSFENENRFTRTKDHGSFRFLHSKQRVKRINDQWNANKIVSTKTTSLQRCIFTRKLRTAQKWVTCFSGQNWLKSNSLSNILRGRTHFKMLSLPSPSHFTVLILVFWSK